MKIAFTWIFLFVNGAVIGFGTAPALFPWLARAFGDSLVATSPNEAVTMHCQFAFGCGILVWAASLGMPAVRWFLIYLLLGISVSVGVALFYHTEYVVAAADPIASGMKTIVTLRALPSFRIPLSGALAIAAMALLRRVSSPRIQDERSPATSK